jgi:hypothetical protein
MNLNVDTRFYLAEIINSYIGSQIDELMDDMSLIYTSFDIKRILSLVRKAIPQELHTVFKRAIVAGNIEMVELLQTNCPDKVDMHKLLELACIYNKHDMVMYLQNIGAIADKETMASACISGDVQMVRLIADSGVSFAEPDCLNTATCFGNKKVIQYLFDNGCKFTRENGPVISHLIDIKDHETIDFICRLTGYALGISVSHHAIHAIIAKKNKVLPSIARCCSREKLQYLIRFAKAVKNDEALNLLENTIA